MKSVVLTKEEQSKREAIAALKVRVHCGTKSHRRYGIVM